MTKRSKLFVDGRLLPVPMLLALAGLFVPMVIHIGGIAQFSIFALAVATFSIARWQFANFPWLLDDIHSELTLPTQMDDRY